MRCHEEARCKFRSAEELIDLNDQQQHGMAWHGYGYGYAAAETNCSAASERCVGKAKKGEKHFTNISLTFH